MYSGQHNVSSASDLGLTNRESADVTLSAADAARFWAKVERRCAIVCWPWCASKSGGAGSWYGQFGVGPRQHRRVIGAHRIAWILTRGTIPGGQDVLHSCDRPECCNPAHLFLGNHFDNMRDASRKGRLSVPRPSSRVLTDAQRASVRARYAAGGLTLQQLADEHRVTKTHIWQIVHRYSVEVRRRSA